ncbi:MAG: hypothetical protein P1V13_01870 [Rhizobiaceae bacterium]|nr:hypothetical protein [Rhizobiaceae bacterium]
MSQKDQPRQWRIIVGATSFADANSAIALAVGLASELDGEINACLIDDEAVLAYAALPFARTIFPGGGKAEPVTLQAMQSAFRRDAEGFRKAIENAASLGAFRWTFQQKRGELRSLLPTALGERDIVVIGRQRLHGRAGDLYVLDDASQPAERLYAMALRTADRLKVPINVLIWGKDAAAVDARQTWVEQTWVEQTCSNSNVPIQCVCGTAFDRTVLDAIAKNSPAAMMLSRSVADQLDLEQLLDIGRCPVLVVAD